MMKSRSLAFLAAGSIALTGLTAGSAFAAEGDSELTVTTVAGAGTDLNLVVNADDESAYASAQQNLATAQVNLDAAKAALANVIKPGSPAYKAQQRVAKADAAAKRAEAKAAQVKGKLSKTDRAALVAAKKEQAAARAALVKEQAKLGKVYGQAKAAVGKAQGALEDAQAAVDTAYAALHPLALPATATVSYSCETATDADLAEWQAKGSVGETPTHRVVQTMTIPEGSYRLWAFRGNDWLDSVVTPYDVNDAVTTVVERKAFETVAAGQAQEVVVDGTAKTYPVGHYNDDADAPHYFSLTATDVAGEYDVQSVDTAAEATFTPSATVTCQG